jgi:predicted DNA-binding transcriptional regulator AlpA
MKQYIDSKEVASLLGICRSTLTYRIQKGFFLAPAKKSKKYEWYLPDVICYLENGGKQAAAPFKKVLNEHA